MILLVGATGKVGRYVVSGLLGRGMEVRALARRPESAWAAVEDAIAGSGGVVPRTALDTWAGFAESPEVVTPTVEEVTGHPARTFAEWAPGARGRLPLMADLVGDVMALDAGHELARLARADR